MIIVSDSVKPPPHPFYGDSYRRGLDPFHSDAAPEELKENSVWRRGERMEGWFLLDAYDQEIGWIPDGSKFPTKDNQVD